MGWGHDSNRNLVQYQLGIPEFNLESPKNKTMKQINKQQQHKSLGHLDKKEL
jgi:hypothetical protein